MVFYITLMSAPFWYMLYPIVWTGSWFSWKCFGKTWKYSCWIKFMLQMSLVSIYWQCGCGWIYFLSYSIIVCYLLAHQACNSYTIFCYSWSMLWYDSGELLIHHFILSMNLLFLAISWQYRPVLLLSFWKFHVLVFSPLTTHVWVGLNMRSYW